MEKFTDKELYKIGEIVQFFQRKAVYEFCKTFIDDIVICNINSNAYKLDAFEEINIIKKKFYNTFNVDFDEFTKSIQASQTTK